MFKQSTDEYGDLDLRTCACAQVSKTGDARVGLIGFPSVQVSDDSRPLVGLDVETPKFWIQLPPPSGVKYVNIKENGGMTLGKKDKAKSKRISQ